MNEIALFPLAAVLFPGGRMPLQIFEQRYLDLIRSCLREDIGFGVVWITKGQEVVPSGGATPTLAEYGVEARIVDWDSLPNNLLGITIEGGDRFHLNSTRTAGNGLQWGDIEMCEPQSEESMVEDWATMLEVLSTLEQHPHVQSLGIDVDHSNAWQVGYALAQLLPVEESVKYELLAKAEIEIFMAGLDQLLCQLSGEAD